MAKDSELNMTLKYITGIDISFVIDDIIRDFVDPNIPVNIDENFSIDVDTPYGICNIATKYVEDHYEVIFKRMISEAYYEEFVLKVYSKGTSWLHGRTIELREKGYVINNIEKIYVSGNLTKGIGNSINYVSKIQRVYSKEDYFNKKFGRFGRLFFKVLNALEKDPYKILNALEKEERKDNYYKWYPILIDPKYENTVSMCIPFPTSEKTTFVDVVIDNCDCSHLYPMLNGDNIVGRTFNLYEGIVNQENYRDVLNLISREDFSKMFAHEDYNDGISSINERIANLAGNPIINLKREYGEYSSYVKDIINRHHQRIKKDQFVVDEHSFASTDKKRELEKKEYVKIIKI